MLNTLDMYGICHEIYRDFSGEFVYSEIDETILNFIFRLYNVTEIDCEEIISLWIEWLKNGKLSVNDMIKRSRMREEGIIIVELLKAD